VALSWRGTPYAHGMSVKGVGCDCIGLIRGVWREHLGSEPCLIPPYSPDWAEVSGGEQLIDGLSKVSQKLDMPMAIPGDILVFCMKPQAPAKHAAILIEGDRVADRQAKILHAYWGHAVVVSWLSPFWVRHINAAFRFPKKGL
jgi:NlpC/P60 family putative phage cell wall peptidase